MDLKKVYTELVQNRTSANYSVRELEAHPGAFIGVDAQARPCFFLSTNENKLCPSIVTSKLELCLNMPYTKLSNEGKMGTGNFQSIALKSNDSSEIESFLYIVEGFVKNQEPGPIISNSVIDFFDSARRLFSIEPAKDLTLAQQGLWGELFLMQNNGGFRFWAPYWHSEGNLTYDFSTIGKRLEVKTTTSQQRIHNFSHRQLYSEKDKVVIASLLLHHDDTGLSLRQLLDVAKIELINTPNYFKLEKEIRKAGMTDLSITGPVFNLAEAQINLKWFDASVVPRFGSPEPEGVSETHYKSDLTHVPALVKKEVDEWCESWTVIRE